MFASACISVPRKGVPSVTKPTVAPRSGFKSGVMSAWRRPYHGMSVSCQGILCSLPATHVCDDQTTEAVTNKHDRTVRAARLSSKCIQAAHEVLASGLKPSRRSVGVPPRVVVVRYDSGSRENCGQHGRVTEPVDELSRHLVPPCPRPVHIGAKAMHGDDAATHSVL